MLFLELAASFWWRFFLSQQQIPLRMPILNYDFSPPDVRFAHRGKQTVDRPLLIEYLLVRHLQTSVGGVHDLCPTFFGIKLDDPMCRLLLSLEDRRD
jgi:hypothetical protein